MEFQQYKSRVLEQITTDRNIDSLIPIKTLGPRNSWWFDPHSCYDAYGCELWVNTYNGVLANPTHALPKIKFFNPAWVVSAPGARAHGNLIPHGWAVVRSQELANASLVTCSETPYTAYLQTTPALLSHRRLGTFVDYCSFLPKTLRFTVEYLGHEVYAHLARFKIKDNRVVVTNELTYSGMWLDGNGWPAFILEGIDLVVTYPEIAIIDVRCYSEHALAFFSGYQKFIDIRNRAN